MEQENVEKQRASEKDDKLQNTLTLKLKRIETTLKEFQLLLFNVNSARIFFHVSNINNLLFKELIIIVVRLTQLMMMMVKVQFQPLDLHHITKYKISLSFWNYTLNLTSKLCFP